MRKILFAAVALLLACLQVAASGAGASPLSGMKERMATSEISFDYSYSAVSGKVRMTGEGSALLDGTSFILKVDGLDIYCDGQTKWTLDTGAREIVIETFDRNDADLSANPALLLSNVEEYFDIRTQETVAYKGGKAVRLELAPVSYPSLKKVVLYFSAEDDDILKGAEITASDGTVSEFSIEDF